jgi:3-dehydroquinate dehydratase
MMLSEDDVQETHARRLLAGLDRNLDFLSDLVKKRVSPENQKEVLDLIERGRTLKNSRNDNTHAVWGEMVDVQTANFAV